MSVPKLSVIMPAYNVEDFISEAIHSVLTQDFTDFEFIIINDGSTDNTEAIIKSFNDIRIILINQVNLGVAAALNNGISIARSNWIARFDADDICLPHRFQIQMSFLASNPEYVITGTGAIYTDMKGKEIFSYRPPAASNESINKFKNRLCPFIHSSVICNREAILSAGSYDERAHGFEDHLLWLKVLKKGKGYNIDQPLIKVRLNPGSATIDEKWQTYRYRQLKNKIIQKEFITDAEGEQLKKECDIQNNLPGKFGAYHALLGKKYLWNKYNPTAARKHLSTSWKSKATLSVLFLYFLSFIPFYIINRLYRLIKPSYSSVLNSSIS